jgi:hypothetical protein
MIVVSIVALLAAAVFFYVGARWGASRMLRFAQCIERTGGDLTRGGPCDNYDSKAAIHLTGMK